jgi:hypothetical protein
MKARQDAHFDTARNELKAHIDRYVANPATKEELSHLIASFTAAAVRRDRIHRQTTQGLAKLFDVFFNGRPA